MDYIENLQNLEGNEHFERMGEFNQNKLSCFGLIIFIFFKLMLGLKKVFDDTYDHVMQYFRHTLYFRLLRRSCTHDVLFYT